MLRSIVSIVPSRTDHPDGSWSSTSTHATPSLEPELLIVSRNGELHCPQFPLPSEDGTEDASTVPFSYDEGGSGYVPIPNDRRRPMGRS